MKATLVVRRLRAFLLVLAGSLCAGTVVELLLVDHTEDPVQWVPFVLCGIGLAAVAAALLRPMREVLLALRGVMGLLVAGSLYGGYAHLAGNLAFELEMRPGAVWSDVWLVALKGAAPLLAPGILALASVLALAATYGHPAISGAPRSDVA
jgi:hypothetical protein